MVTGTSCSAQAASTIAAASGSWKTLNSAAAVALLISTPPPMKTIAPDRGERRRVHPGQQRQVGHRGERHDGEHLARRRGGLEGVAQEVDRGARVGAQGGGRHPEVGHAVVAVHVARVDRLLEQGPRGTGAHRHVAAAGGLEHGQGVAHDVGQGCVAADTGHRAQVEARVQRGEQEGTGVVDTRVDVEDHGEGGHGVDCVGCRRPRTTVEGGEHAGRARTSSAGHAASPRTRRVLYSRPGLPRHSAGWRGVTYRRLVLSATPRPLPTRRLAATTSALLALALAGCAGDPAGPPSTATDPLDGAVERRPEHGIRLAVSHARPGRGLRVDDVRRPDPRPAARPAAHGRLRRHRTPGVARRPGRRLARRQRHLPRRVGRRRQGDPHLGAPPGAGLGHEHRRRRAARRRRPGGRRRAPAARRGLHPAAVGQAAGDDVVIRADQGRHRLGARDEGRRGQRQPGAGHRHGAGRHRPRQRADRQVGAAVRLRPRRPSSGPRRRS